MSDAMTRRAMLRLGLLGAGVVAFPEVLSACGSSGSKASSTSSASATTLDPVMRAAKREGTVNLIAVGDGPSSPYRFVLDGFRKQTGIKTNLLNASAGSGIELDAVRSGKGKPNQPDVVDVGLSAALQGTTEGLFAPLRVDGWDDIPSAAKDVNGAWLSSYYALVGIATNRDKLGPNDVPTSFDDLAGLTGGVKMGIPGDPRTTDAAGPLASSSAFGAVWTAALASKEGSLDNIGPGIDYFKRLAADKIFDPSMLAIAQTVADGSVPISMLLNSDFSRAVGFVAADKAKADLVFRIAESPTLYPNYYAQAAIAGSPHPNAAKLWLNYLVSDDGAKALLKGGLVPTRLTVMKSQGAVADSDFGAFEDMGVKVDKLMSELAAVQIPTVEQVNRAQDEVNQRWGPEVLGK